MAGKEASVLRELQDREAIKELMASYCYIIDQRNWDNVPTLFTPDATANYGPLGEVEGRDSIQEWFETVVEENLPFHRHMIHNPIIESNDDSASGKWYLESPAIAGQDQAIWIQGTYENEFSRLDGEWKISLLNFDFHYATPHEQGWAEQAFIEDIPGELEM